MKSNVLPFLGLLILTVFILLSYLNNSIFLENLIACSVILGIVFLLKIGESQTSKKRNSTK